MVQYALSVVVCSAFIYTEIKCRKEKALERKPIVSMHAQLCIQGTDIYSSQQAIIQGDHRYAGESIL